MTNASRTLSLGDPLRLHGALFAVVVMAAVAGALVLTSTEVTRTAALAGVVVCGVTGVFSLALKWMTNTVHGALAVVVLMFGVRAAAVLLGAIASQRLGGGVMPYAFGFFAAYFPLQWVEISYLSMKQKQLQPQAQVEQR